MVTTITNAEHSRELGSKQTIKQDVKGTWWTATLPSSGAIKYLLLGNKGIFPSCVAKVPSVQILEIPRVELYRKEGLAAAVVLDSTLQVW